MTCHRNRLAGHDRGCHVRDGRTSPPSRGQPKGPELAVPATGRSGARRGQVLRGREGTRGGLWGDRL